jgi:hypothetical protein
MVCERQTAEFMLVNLFSQPFLFISLQIKGAWTAVTWLWGFSLDQLHPIDLDPLILHTRLHDNFFLSFLIGSPPVVFPSQAITANLTHKFTMASKSPAYRVH